MWSSGWPMTGWLRCSSSFKTAGNRPHSRQQQQQVGWRVGHKKEHTNKHGFGSACRFHTNLYSPEAMHTHCINLLQLWQYLLSSYCPKTDCGSSTAYCVSTCRGIICIWFAGWAVLSTGQALYPYCAWGSVIITTSRLCSMQWSSDGHQLNTY